MPYPHKLADGRYECQNCLRKFTKNAKTYKDPLFCSDVCRKEFHYQGGMSLKRLEHKVRQWMREEWAAIKAEEVLAASVGAPPVIGSAEKVRRRA